MTLVKGRLTQIELAQDGSSVKLRLSDGNAVRLDLDDLESVGEKIVDAMIGAKINSTENPDGVATRYEPAPLVIKAVDVNVNHFIESDVFSVSAADRHGRRAILQLDSKYVRFLIDTYQRTRKSETGPTLQ